MKRCSTYLAIRETPLISHKISLHTIERSTMKNSETSCWTGCKESGSLKLCRWECKMGEPLEYSLTISYRIKHATIIQNNNCTFEQSANVHKHLLCNNSKLETTQMSCKAGYIHTREYSSAIKRNKFLIHTTAWMNLQGSMLNE